MNRYYYSFILCLAVFAGTLFSCTNEEDGGNPANGVNGLETNVDFLELTDTNTDMAGALTIMANVPEVTLKWNTVPNCNLDTMQTTISLKNGRGMLPVKWQRQLEAGTRGPEGVAYKAGVQIIAGEYAKYIPLIWSEKADSANLAKLAALPKQTRATVSEMALVPQISITPTSVALDYENGGAMSITLTGVPFAILDFSEFTSDMNLDLTNFPTLITESQVLNFRWKNGNGPAYPFTARVIVMSEELVQYAEVTYTPPVDPGTLDFVNSNLPTGNIPQSGGSYTFTFAGTYMGTVQLRCLANGVVAATGVAVNDKRASVTVPQNMTTDKRAVTFQYKRENGDWMDLPAGTNRTQEESGIGIVVAGITWAPGNLVKVGNVYKFRESQSAYSSVWNGGDYWKWNDLDPLAWQNTNLSYSWSYANDPCRQVAPAGSWRTPTSNELMALKSTVNSWGYYNNVAGRYFGPNNELFLPAAGYRPKTTSITSAGVVGFYWASSQKAPGDNAYMMGFDSGRVNVDYNGHRANSSQIRCVSVR